MTKRFQRKNIEQPSTVTYSRFMLLSSTKITTLMSILFIALFAALGTYFLHASKAATLTGDINGDGTVNVFDLSLLLSSFGQSTPTCATANQDTCDLNSDGSVNIFDLSILLSNWGQSNGGGGATQVGAPTPAGVTCTGTPLNPGANVQSALSAASPGDVICLNAGSWSAITISGVSKAAPGVTLAATPGQTVAVPGIHVSGGNQNLTVEGFNITTANANGNSIALYLTGTDSNITFKYNTLENQSNGYGVYSYPGSTSNSATNITVEYNQIDNDSTFIEVDGGAGEQSNWTIAHNVMGPGQNFGGDGHYIQIGGIAGATINNNAFEGPSTGRDTDTTAHNNVFHCWSNAGDPACTNVTFDNNILWHTDSRAQSVLITDNVLTNIHLDNNLDIEDPAPACSTGSTCPASPWFIEKAHGVTLLHNTSVAPWSINLGTCGDGCITDPQNYDAEYNIATGTPQTGQSNYGLFTCTSSCVAQYNTSQDNSANTVLGGPGNVINWTPNWATTTWTPVVGPGYQPPPAGYYQPVGLSISGAGYQGTIGP